LLVHNPSGQVGPGCSGGAALHDDVVEIGATHFRQQVVANAGRSCAVTEKRHAIFVATKGANIPCNIPNLDFK